jgi:bacterioferritin-associated ferredoxin
VYVCICAAVTEAQVRACVDAGASTAEEVGQRCGAGTGCGSCLDRLDVIIQDCGCATAALLEEPVIPVGGSRLALEVPPDCWVTGGPYARRRRGDRTPQRTANQ